MWEEGGEARTDTEIGTTNNDDGKKAIFSLLDERVGKRKIVDKNHK